MKKWIAIWMAIALALSAAALAEGDYTYYPESEAYVGTWRADENVLEIAHMYDDYSLYNCVVTQYTGDNEGVRWIYDACTYDDVGKALTSLEIGMKFAVVFGQDGEPVSNEEIFSDGAAAFALNEDGTLTWTDFKETPGENQRVFERAADAPDYSGVTTLDSAEVEAFAASVRQAYLDGDWEALATKIDYPIEINFKQRVDDPAGFMAVMAGKMPTAEDAAEMEAEDCRALFANGQGICMGSGQIWFLDVHFDGIEQTDDPLLRIISLCGVE